MASLSSSLAEEDDVAAVVGEEEGERGGVDTVGEDISGSGDDNGGT